MITLTWNIHHTTLKSFHRFCKENYGALINCKEKKAHCIAEVSHIFQFTPPGKKETARKAFVLKLRTGFGWECPVVKSFLISVSPDGSLHNGDQLAAYIHMSYESRPASETQGFFAGIKNNVMAFMPQRTVRVKAYVHS